MTRLLVHVEGETEEDFVDVVLGPHLYGSGYWSVDARLIGNSRIRARRGGIRGWQQVVRKDVVRHLREDAGCYAALMVDYYRLPQSGKRAWPGRAESIGVPMASRADYVESALCQDLTKLPDGELLKRRFIPCIVMHEFEALLFSDCERFATAIGRFELSESLQAIRDEFESPEAIDDSPLTAPSKRIEGLIPEYQKRIDGINAARHIGLERIRNECPSFANWLSRLESIPAID